MIILLICEESISSKNSQKIFYFDLECQNHQQAIVDNQIILTNLITKIIIINQWSG